MLRKSLLFALYIFAFYNTAKTQQLPLVAQHPEYHGLLNPASLNSDFMNDERNLSVGASFRQQWVQLGALSPSTQVLRGEYIDADNHFLVGGYFIRDKVGITTNTGFYGRAAYIIPIGSDYSQGGAESGISIGLNLGIANWQLQTRNLSLNQLDDPDVPNNPSSWYPDVGFGAYWYQNLGKANHYFYMGLSAPRTFEFRNDYQGAKRYPHYYGLLGYVFPLPTSDNAFLEVSAWSRYVENIPLQNSFHLKIQPMEFINLGIGVVSDFKTKPLMLFEIGTNIATEFNTLKIGYSYTWGSFIGHFGATHEFNVAFVMDTRR